MAKRSGMYKFEKRRKELVKKKKQEEKRQKRLSKGADDQDPDVDPTIMTPEEMAEMGLGPLVNQDTEDEDTDDEDADEDDDSDVDED